MMDDFKSILYSEEKIKERVGELGAQITKDYKDGSPILLGVLKGSFIFMADLSRQISLSCELRFISASSYGNNAVTSGTVNIAHKQDFEIANRDIILVEDILDTGVTLTAMKKYLAEFSPNSIKICALLDKISRRTVPIKADYVGFTCPDEFLVGYGLDYAERYRNLPFIASLKPEVYS